MCGIRKESIRGDNRLSERGVGKVINTCNGEYNGAGQGEVGGAAKAEHVQNAIRTPITCTLI